MSIARCGSRLPVGSSARISAGSGTIALATATRCFSPPERLLVSSGPRPARADALERFGHARSDEPLRHRDDLERHRDVLEDRPVVDDPEVLKHDAEVAPKERNRLVGQPPDVTTAEEHPALVDP